MLIVAVPQSHLIVLSIYFPNSSCQALTLKVSVVSFLKIISSNLRRQLVTNEAENNLRFSLAVQMFTEAIWSFLSTLLEIHLELYHIM